MAKAKEITLLGGNELPRESANLSKAVGNLDARIQRYLCSEIAHIEEHRDPSRLSNFLRTIKGTGSRVNAMHYFVQEFANIRMYDAEKDKAKYPTLKAGDYIVKAVRSAEEGRERLAKAMQTAWTTFKPETEPMQFVAADKAKTFLTMMFTHGVTIEEVQELLTTVQADATVAAQKAIDKAKKSAAKVGLVVTSDLNAIK